VTELASDWYRMTTGKAERSRRDDEVVSMRRALGLLRDRVLLRALAKILADAPLLAPNARYVCCPQLGAEHYALTHKGWRIRRSLDVRLQRFGSAPFKTFLHAFDKIERKMQEFGTDVTRLRHNIGHVKKNREQVVIGLVKTGVPADAALGAYRTALREVHAPDVAVTCARNAATFGSPLHAAHRLRAAEAALLRAGYPSLPEAIGAAKSLLAFQPPEAGVPRFVDFMRRLEPVLGSSPLLFKYTARLMPAAGFPADVVARVVMARDLLRRMPSPLSRDLAAPAVALASMARTIEAVPELVTRYRHVEHELVRAGVSQPQYAESDALECVACPGTPAEVVDTVALLAERLNEGRRPRRGDVAIAAAFAKRFAY
jgi:hypothetical protein